jgi:hypothetical protein
VLPISYHGSSNRKLVWRPLIFGRILRKRLMDLYIQLVVHVKEDKTKTIILDLVKKYLIPHIIENILGKLMYDALVGLYQSFGC